MIATLDLFMGPSDLANTTPMESYAPTERTRVRRVAQRATYDRAAVHAILDEARFVSVAFTVDDQPYIIPMAFVRMGDSVFLHGSTRARVLETIAAGVPVCVSATICDGLILARSAFHHSMNYRSVAILGRGRAVAEEARRMEVLEALTEHLMPGRWEHVRAPTTQEMKATLVVEVPIEEVVAKQRFGGPKDDPEDMPFPVWAGTIPLTETVGAPIQDPAQEGEQPLPDHVRALSGS